MDGNHGEVPRIEHLGSFDQVTHSPSISKRIRDDRQGKHDERRQVSCLRKPSENRRRLRPGQNYLVYSQKPERWKISGGRQIRQHWKESGRDREKQQYRQQHRHRDALQER